MFINDNTAQIPELKREQLFIDLLENLVHAESQLLIRSRIRNLKAIMITKKVIEKVYPDWNLLLIVAQTEKTFVGAISSPLAVAVFAVELPELLYPHWCD